ncbi:MAG: VanW family protein, partial [Polyangiaceae bacterium]|nr:VanW family protein [Polyangiaceae bacterium]
RHHSASHPPQNNIPLPITVSINTERAIATLLELKDHVDRPAINVRLDLQNRILLPEQHGIQLDIHGTIARIEHAFRNGETEIDAVIATIEPTQKADQLNNIAFDDILGYFETAYARGSKHDLRNFNLRLAASRLDGHIVMPGDTFDFNTVVGPRDEAHGYKIAPVIAEGELVDGIGGGTCQISGTLHAAAYFAGLEIVSRRPHTRPSSYIKMGLDAAVSYPTITLKLKNNFPFPVVLHETVRDGIVRAEILGPRRDTTVTFVRKILDIQPYQEIERPDSKLPSGTRRLSQRGVPGFKVQKHRILRNGPFAVRERTVDSYPPTAQIIRVGTGTTGTATGQDDSHLEYTADEYLMVTQGPGILTRGVERDVPGGPMIENRTPGKTGKPGWMQAAGFPVFRPDSAASP